MNLAIVGRARGEDLSFHPAASQSSSVFIALFISFSIYPANQGKSQPINVVMQSPDEASLLLLEGSFISH